MELAIILRIQLGIGGSRRFFQFAACRIKLSPHIVQYEFSICHHAHIQERGERIFGHGRWPFSAVCFASEGTEKLRFLRR